MSERISDTATSKRARAVLILRDMFQHLQFDYVASVFMLLCGFRGPCPRSASACRASLV